MKSRHEFVVVNQDGKRVQWLLEFEKDGVNFTLSHQGGQAVSAWLPPATAEDLRELLAMYQNSRKRSGA